MRSRIARRLAAGAAVGIVLSLAACSSQEQRFAKHIARAQELRDAGQLEEALRELRSALQLDPGSADVNFRIAELLAKDKQPADAVFFYRETTRLDPSRSDAALAEAKLILFNDTARAEQLVAQVLEREPRNATAYIRRSELALARGKSADALQDARTATELAPLDGMAHMQLGIVHQARLREQALKREKPEESVYQDAEKALTRAAELFPHGVFPRIELGRLYAVWADHGGQAIAAFRAAIAVAENDENRARAVAAAIPFARATGNVEFQRSSLETMVETVPANLAAWDELAGLEDQREKGSGDAIYQRLFAARPQDTDAHLHYASFLFSRDRFDACFAHLDEAAKSASDPALVLDYSVALRLRRNEVEPARVALDRLAKEYPTHARTELARGRMALAENRTDEAADALRRYAAMEQTAEGQRLLAIAELRRHDIPAATAALDRALQLEGGSGDIETLRLVATVRASAGDFPQVLQTLNRVARETGELRSNEKLMYARALYATGRRPAAKALYEKVLARQGNLSGAKNDLAWILAEEGTDLERALTLAREAQQAEPESAEIADTVGYVYLKERLFEPALEHFERAVEMSGRAPDDVQEERPGYHYHRGLALKALGRNDEAATAFERALHLDDDFPDAEDARRQLEAVRISTAAGPG